MLRASLPGVHGISVEGVIDITVQEACGGDRISNYRRVRLSTFGRLWVRSEDAVSDIDVAIGRHVVVGDEDADPRVARVVSIDSRGNIELEILRGSVESHAGLLAHA